MKKLIKIAYIIFSLLFITICCDKIYPGHAVTYTFTGGRFGDNLGMYMLGKWVAYKHGMELLYKPFHYSDHLVLHNIEKRFDNEMQKYPTSIQLKQGTKIDPDEKKSILYVINAYDGSFFEDYPVNWEDQGFKAELKKMITPQQAFPKIAFPQGYVTVAVHVRKGGYEGDEKDLQDRIPRKFLPEEYYIDQIAQLYQRCKGVPLYIFIFTDDDNPMAIKHRFEQIFSSGYNIKFDCRMTLNRHNINVLEDYFAFFQFDCFIHGLSNFAVCASWMGDHCIDIAPLEFKRENGKTIVSKLDIIERLHLAPKILTDHLSSQNMPKH